MCMHAACGHSDCRTHGLNVGWYVLDYYAVSEFGSWDGCRMVFLILWSFVLEMERAMICLLYDSDKHLIHGVSFVSIMIGKILSRKSGTARMQFPSAQEHWQRLSSATLSCEVYWITSLQGQFSDVPWADYLRKSTGMAQEPTYRIEKSP